MIVLKNLIFVLFMVLVTGCSHPIQSHGVIPSNKVISLFAMQNYTDTPNAGKRASNILEGVLLGKAYKVISHLEKPNLSQKEMKKIAKKDGANYYISGGISEWRYKTGIDGEPAVSLKAVMYSTKDASVVWSATSSESDWGTSSIGTTAQNLFESMIK